jgi:hypothetical protein
MAAGASETPLQTIAASAPVIEMHSTPQTLPVSSMSDVLQYLNSQNGPGYSMFNLPSGSFKRMGAPKIVPLKDGGGSE